MARTAARPCPTSNPVDRATQREASSPLLDKERGPPAARVAERLLGESEVPGVVREAPFHDRADGVPDAREREAAQGRSEGLPPQNRRHGLVRSLVDQRGPAGSLCPKPRRRRERSGECAMDERPALASVGELAHWTLGARVEDLRGESLKGAGREALEVRHRERAILPAGLCDEGRGDLRMQRERILQIAEDGIARWGNDFESSLTRSARFARAEQR